MAMTEELLELDDKPSVVDSGAPPRYVEIMVESVTKPKKLWENKWVKTFATVWLPILCACYFIVSYVVTHAVSDLETSMGQTMDNKIIPVSNKLDAVNNRLSNMEGWREAVQERDLHGISQKLKDAEKEKQTLSLEQLSEFRNIVLKSPTSLRDYWSTVAEIVNYQSLLNQRNGEAPDPAKVSRPCEMVTSNGGRSHDNTFIGMPISGCIVDLDTNNFKNVTFKNSVVRYHGGPVFLINVRFENCRFILDSVAKPDISAQKTLLFAILNSPDQTTVHVVG